YRGRDPPVGEFEFPLLSRLAFEGEAKARTFDLQMPGTQCRQAEALVLAAIDIVADADQRPVEQADHRSNHPLARQPAPPQIRIHLLSELGQSMSKGGEAGELSLVAAGGPAGMVAVLLAAALIAAGRLNVAGRIAADPDIGPGRRKDQRPGALPDVP